MTFPAKTEEEYFAEMAPFTKCDKRIGLRMRLRTRNKNLSIVPDAESEAETVRTLNELVSFRTRPTPFGALGR